MRTRQPQVAMRVTAIRVGDDLRSLLESEAARVGVSVSQYIREAALARACAAAAARGEDPYELLARAGGPERQPPVAALNSDTAQQPARGQRARTSAQDARSGARAVRAQSEQLRRHLRPVDPRDRPGG